MPACEHHFLSPNGPHAKREESGTASYWKARTSTDLQAVARSVRAEFSPSSGYAVAVSEFQEVTYMLVNAAIQAFDMAALIPRKPTVSYSEVIWHILELIRFCFQVDAVSKCQDFLLKLLEPPAGFTIYQYVDKVLVPLIPVLKTFLAIVQLDYQSDPFRTFCVTVVKPTQNTIVGLKLHQLVAAAELEGVCDIGVGIYLGHPQAREPTYSQNYKTMTTANPVLSNQRGMALLAELGDSATQRVIFGPDHDRILAKMMAPKKSTAPSTSQKRPSTQPAKGGQVQKRRNRGENYQPGKGSSAMPNSRFRRVPPTKRKYWPRAECEVGHASRREGPLATFREEESRCSDATSRHLPSTGREYGGTSVRMDCGWDRNFRMKFAEVVDMRQSSIVDKDGPNRVRSPSQLVSGVCGVKSSSSSAIQCKERIKLGRGTSEDSAILEERRYVALTQSDVTK
ncbi:hypothetical protein B0H11DRAFT_2198232 [Mycena galericulata]|nr:hypothetical protein B0H11DRAFT_2198232 [Mycena galericulata]